MTLFELAYACTIFGNDKAYDEMRKALGEDADLASDSQCESLLKFLNKWGCRITESDFPSIKQNLKAWASRSLDLLPKPDTDIRSLTPCEHDKIAEAYNDALLTVGPRFKETAISKTLHAIRPISLPAWDNEIKSRFSKERPIPQSTLGQEYAAFVVHVAEEISNLQADASKKGLALHEIPHKIGKPNYSLVKLVDEYKWIAITGKCRFPERTKLEDWVRWS